MQKLLLMSDLHITAEGIRTAGGDPLRRFRAALTHALRRHGDARALILMGDLAETGTPEEYARLRLALAGLTLPVLPMTGNHDRRAALRATFPEAPTTPEGHVQTALDLPHHRLILLDTLDEEAPGHGGRLCAARLAWLDRALAGRGDRRPVVFTHHPAAPVGIPWLDRIGLAEAGALLDRLAPARAYLVSGHVHRSVSGQHSGVNWAIVASTSHRNPLDLGRPAPTARETAPPGYAVLLLGEAGVTLHAEEAPEPGP